jgi:pyruvate/2-oxoglutarate dehydrogenase complex dihydrolipoamide acyltransferase (E2) component
MALAEEYGKLSMPDLLTHYQAIKHVLAEKMPPPAPEAPAAESAPPPEAPAMGKSEAAPAAAAPAPEVVALQADLAASQQAIGHLVKAVEQALARPLRKAVTSLSDVAPSAAEADATKDMSPEEVTRRLRDAAKNPKLSKSDRDLINRYCFKQADLTQIKHLLAGA